jgi:sterol desaturase/sphingolipid hydroxylase (fatty acid hydroxylase superfamily)
MVVERFCPRLSPRPIELSNFYLLLIYSFFAWFIKLVPAAFCGGGGLLSVLPASVGFWLSILLFDFFIYAQHVMSHKIDFFYRFHRVHHSDEGFDTSTAVRFHPVEIWASACYKIGLIWLWGFPKEAVIVGEVLLSSGALFNHANLNLGRWDRLLSWVIVTPDWHRVHHFKESERHNFAFFFSIWDRLFLTYLPYSQEKVIGTSVKGKGLKALLLMPF